MNPPETIPKKIIPMVPPYHVTHPTSTHLTPPYPNYLVTKRLYPGFGGVCGNKEGTKEAPNSGLAPESDDDISAFLRHQAGTSVVVQAGCRGGSGGAGAGEFNASSLPNPCLCLVSAPSGSQSEECVYPQQNKNHRGVLLFIETNQ